MKYLVSFAIACATASCQAIAGDVSFNRDVRPILSDRCFKCHGPDATNQDSEFRLDTFEHASEDLGGYTGIVPGRVDESDLVDRIFATDDGQMPPADQLRQLTDNEKQILVEWIKAGASFDSHWAFKPLPPSVHVPTTNNVWPRAEIDHFVFHGLRETGLVPNRDAPREKWLRRVTFDLTGLPPTVAEINTFLADTSGHAYQRVVDRLLQSEACAERLASEWLDVARYADSYGYQRDDERFVWPWRDWVDVFVQAGAKFAGPVGEHSDGFSMWDSTVNRWNVANMGPRRDVVAEMKKAIEKRDLKFLVSMHHAWHWAWFPTWDKETDAADPKHASLYGPALPSIRAQSGVTPDGKNTNMYSHPMPSDEFEQTWLAKVNEVVTGYSPDLLWFDNRMQILSEGARMEMAAGYYNHALSQGQRPVLTYKRPDMAVGTATVDLERSRMPDIYPDPWLTDTSISPSTWSFASDMEYYSVDRIVDDLVDIVSKNGCMLLNIAPAPDGMIPDAQKEILRGIVDVSLVGHDGKIKWKRNEERLFIEIPAATPCKHAFVFKITRQS